MADATAISVVNVSPALGGTLLRINATKANANDVINVPAGYGSTVVWNDFVKESTGVKDPVTATSNLALTMSTGTGDMVGLVLVE